ncbi:MAG: bifunctional diaminohydroxyphosphoribosylaminopyrimidine deaminase/5-amino-6-(5-phosphoribosylamino)uracil reductase RibD [Endomicrobiia bacterium]
MNDKKYIRYCFELAKKSLGKTSPNPIVGAVIVYKNKIIAEGYHTEYGKPHAEVEAINDAIKKGYKNLLPKSTLYVNLEPCCHWGKTPPCVNKIIDVGIKKVVCSMYDPNPKVNSKGIEILEKNDVKCKVGVLEDEAKELNKFYIKWITKKLPYVTIKSAITFDGKIATVLGESKWISSKQSRNYVYKLRSIYDAVLVGINTVLKDNPKLTTHNFGRNPQRVVVGDITKFFNIYNKYNVFKDDNKTIFFTPQSKLTKIIVKKFNNVEVVEFKEKKILFKKILSYLAQKGISSVLVEGGGETNWNLINENLVDDFILIVAGKIFGGRDAKTWVEGAGVKLPHQAYRIKFLNIEHIGEDFIINAKMVK